MRRTTFILIGLVVTLVGALAAAGELGSGKADLIDTATGEAAGTVQVKIRKDGIDATFRLKDGLPDTGYWVGLDITWDLPPEQRPPFIPLLVNVTTDSHGRLKLDYFLGATPEEIALIASVKGLARNSEQILMSADVPFP